MHSNSLLKAVYRASSWWHWMWIAIVVLVLMLIIEWLIVLSEIERAYHRAEVNNFRADLSEMWVRRQLRHQSTGVADVAHINPVELMTKPPEHYLGAFKQRPKDVRSTWFYETQHDCFIYVFSDGEIASYRLLAKHSSVDLVTRFCDIKKGD